MLEFLQKTNLSQKEVSKLLKMTANLRLAAYSAGLRSEEDSWRTERMERNFREMTEFIKSLE